MGPMSKYDVLRYALNNDNKLPRVKTPRPGKASGGGKSMVPSGGGKSMVPSGGGKSMVPSAARAGAAKTVGSVASRAAGAAGLMAYSKDAGRGSDKPTGPSTRVMGATKGETAGRMKDVAAQRKSVPMSPLRQDAVPPSASKNVATKAGAYPVYKKGSAQASSFQSEFAAARKRGDKAFTWNGRSYTTKKA